MKKSKQQPSFVNVGSSSLLLIFLILSLVTFAALSLSGAKGDYNFSSKLAARKTQYYQASNQAEKIIGLIDEKLAECAAVSRGNAEAYRAGVLGTLDGVQLEGCEIAVEAEEDARGQNIAFSVPMSDNQVLYVKMEVTDYTKSENYYKIKAWQAVSEQNWESEQPIRLLPMEE